MRTNHLTTWTTLGLVALISLSIGCASNCGNRGLLGNRPLFPNQPIRNTIRSWFRGDQCDTCNAPTGQISVPNVAPLCNSCGNGAPQINNPVVPTPNLYGAPNSGAQLGSPTLPGNFQPSPDLTGGTPPTL